MKGEYLRTVEKIGDREMQGNVEGIEKVFVSSVFVNDYLKSLHLRLYRKIIQFNPYLLSIEQIVSV